MGRLQAATEEEEGLEVGDMGDMGEEALEEIAVSSSPSGSGRRALTYGLIRAVSNLGAGLLCINWSTVQLTPFTKGTFATTVARAEADADGSR